jgi:photosystem II stability/assembly factor-like uncharacterized protein
VVNGDRQLQETLKWLSGPVDPSGVWANIEARAGRVGAKGGTPARAKRRGLRVAVFASVAVVLGAAIAIGSVATIRHFGQPNFVLAITDDTVMGAAGQLTTHPAAPGTRSGHWQQLLSSEGGTIKALFVDPKNPSALYAETALGLFKSSDGAESWNQALYFSTLADGVILVAFDPASPSTVFLLTSSSEWAAWGTPATRLLRSDDGGATWTDLSKASPTLGGWPVAIWFDTMTSPSTIYASGWRSTDRGASWTELSAEEADRRWAQHWEEPGTDFQNTAFRGMVTDATTGAEFTVLVGRVDPKDPSIRYAGTEEGVYKSTDGGATWKKASSVVWRVVLDPKSPSTLYASTSGGIFKSEDRGSTWNLTLAGQGSVVISPSSPSTLYAWTSAGLFRTDDGGATWSRRAGGGLLSSSSEPGTASGGLVLVSGDNPEVVFAIAGDGSKGLFKSTDGGNTWGEVLEGAVPADDGSLVVADPQDAATLFAAKYPGRVVKSTDAGSTWTVVSPEEWVDPVVEIAIDPHAPSNVYVVQANADGQCMLSRSLDGGVTWEKVGLEGAAKGIRQLLFDPTAPDTLYASTFNIVDSVGQAGLYLSTDGGTRWKNITEELPNRGYLNIVMDPGRGATPYSVTARGLFKWVPSVKQP